MMNTFEVRTRTLLALKAFMYATELDVLIEFTTRCWADKMSSDTVNSSVSKASAEISKLIDQGFVCRVMISGVPMIGLTPEGYSIIV